MDQRAKPSYKTPSSFVTFRLSKLQNNLNAQATAILKERSGLSLVEWRLIQVLRMYENASPTQIANLVHMDKGQLSRKIKAMIRKDLLKLKTDEHDQRVQHIQITKRAQNLSDLMMPAMEARQEILLKDVSSRELESFFKVLEKFEAASKIRDIP